MANGQPLHNRMPPEGMSSAEFERMGHPVHLELGKVRNVRDLGGYPYTAEDGSTGYTAYGVFLRAAALDKLRPVDFAYLHGYQGEGLRRVVDLRSTFETGRRPDPFAEGRDGVTYTAVPMLDQLNSAQGRDQLPDCMFTVYKRLLDEDASSICRVMEALDGMPDEPGASGTALFHCSAGKDRTGVIAMLLLGIAGVSDELIVEDYEATQRYLGRGIRAQRLLVSILLRKPAPRCLFEAVPLEMERTLEHLHTRYGTARDYLLKHAGCSEELVDRLTVKIRGTLG